MVTTCRARFQEVGMKKGRSLNKDSRTGKHYTKIQVNGVRKKFFFSTNRRKAEAELRQLEADIESGARSFEAIANVHVDKTDPKDVTIEELVTRYLDWVETNRAPRTHELKKGLLQPFLDFYGGCMVSDINHGTLAKYYAWAKKYRGRSANGGNRHLRAVKACFRWGEDVDLCLCPVRRFPVMREYPPETKKFTDDELPILLEHASPDFRDMIVFGLMTGLRPQELYPLTRQQVREVKGRPCIVLDKHKTRGSMRISQPRVVPLSPQAVEIVERQKAEHPHSPFIFLNGHGTPYTAGVFRNRLWRACVRAGIPKRSPYALRHYFGTKRAGEGLNQAILAQVMGHTTIVTTTRYVAPVQDYQQKAMDAMAEDLAALLGGPEPEPPEPEPQPELRVVRFPKRRAVGE